MYVVPTQVGEAVTENATLIHISAIRTDNAIFLLLCLIKYPIIGLI